MKTRLFAVAGYVTLSGISDTLISMRRV